MIFNILVFMMIVLITLYLATQGLVSALLALITAIFASVLAMGLMEPLQGLMASWKPDYARGVTLLVLFLAAFAICRVVADIVVPKNIKLPALVNRISGGVLGFFTALVVMGTLVVGVEMMPLPRSLMGYDRFPGETAMYDKDRPGEVSRTMSAVWFDPDRFVEGIWKAVSGGGLGGNYAWGQIHPDLSVESYGYRNSAAVGSTRTVLQDNFDVQAAWMTKDPKVYGQLGIKTTDIDRPVVMVRTVVKNGGGRGGRGSAGGAGGSADTGTTEESGGPYFRVSATQVRLITDKGNQYYPIGYLEQGRNFVPLALNSGRVVDDFVQGQALEDWIFQVKPEEKPAYIEMKELARVALSGAGFVKDAPTGPMAANAYPRKPYFKELSTLAVEVDLKGKKLREGTVYLLRDEATAGDASGEIRTSQSHVQSVLTHIEEGSGGWTAAGKPGVKDVQFFRSARTIGINKGNAAPNEPLTWSEVLPLFLAGQMEADGQRNLDTYPKYFKNTLEPMWHKVAKGDAVVQMVPLDPSGKVDLGKINPGTYQLVVTAQTENAFYVWWQAPAFKASSNLSVKLTIDKPEFAVDMDARPAGATP